MRRFIVVLLLAAFAAGVWSPADGQGETRLAAIEDVEFVAFVTGPDAPSQTDVTYDVYGTDLGSMFDLDGTLYIAFGDTFGCCLPPRAARAGKTGATTSWATPPTGSSKMASRWTA